MALDLHQNDSKIWQITNKIISHWVSIRHTDTAGWEIFFHVLWKKLISHKMITLHTRAVRTTNLWLLAPSTKATKLQLTFAPPLSALKLCHCAALCDETIWRVFRPPFHPPRTSENPCDHTEADCVLLTAH